MIQRKILMICIALCVLTGGASALSEDSWLGSINVTSGTFMQTLTFGTDENGSDGYDQGLDQLAPPASPGATVDVYFTVDDIVFDRLYGDVRYIVNATNPERVWTLHVLSKNEDALLEWDSTALPADIIFTLSAVGSEYNMKGVSSVSLAKGTQYVPITIQTRYSPAISSIVANFTANRTAGITPLTVQFTDTSTGSPTAWLWDFGDGSTSTKQNPVHTYTTVGFYTVSLTVWNAEREGSIVKEDTIAVDATQLAWLGSINVTSGTFMQTLTFGTDENGSDGYDQGLDQLAPPASPGATVDAYFLVDDIMFDHLYGDVRYILNAANPERVWMLQIFSKSEDALLEWDPAALPANIVFTLSLVESEYDMKDISSVSLAKSMSYVPVTIQARYAPTAPSVVVNFTANIVAGIVPFTVHFTDTSSGNPIAWHWTFGDTTTSTDQHPTHTYAAPGNYTVSLSLNGGADTCTRPAYIKVTPLLYGDANDDGTVNQADTLRVLKEVVGLSAKPTTDELFRKTDVHTNGVIEVGDALFIAQYNVGLRDAWFEMRA